MKISIFRILTQIYNYPNYYNYISEILGRLFSSLSKFWLWIFSQRVLSSTASPSLSPDLYPPLAEFPSTDVTIGRAFEPPSTFVIVRTDYHSECTFKNMDWNEPILECLTAFCYRIPSRTNLVLGSFKI